MDIERILSVDSGGIQPSSRCRVRKTVEQISKYIDVPKKSISFSALAENSINRKTDLIIGSNALHEGSYYNEGPIIVLDLHTDLYFGESAEFFSGNWLFYYLRDKGDAHLIIPRYKSLRSMRYFLGNSLLPEKNEFRCYNNMQAKLNRSHMFDLVDNRRKLIKFKNVEEIPNSIKRVSIDDDFVRGTDIKPLLNIISEFIDKEHSFELWISPSTRLPYSSYEKLIDVITNGK